MDYLAAVNILLKRVVLLYADSNAAHLTGPPGWNSSTPKAVLMLSPLAKEQFLPTGSTGKSLMQMPLPCMKCPPLDYPGLRQCPGSDLANGRIFQAGRSSQIDSVCLALVFILLPLPWLVNRLLPRAANRDASLYVPFFTSLSRIEKVTPRIGGNRIIAVLALLCWILLVTAASRPQWVGDPVQLPTTGRDLMLAVDISGSMEAQDIQLNGQNATRLQVVKSVAGDFVRAARG